MYDKIVTGVFEVPAGTLRRWQNDGRAKVIGEGKHGVMVDYGGVPLQVELTDTAEIAEHELAPFYAFHADALRVTRIRITD